MGWRTQIPGEDPIERPPAVERQHSWVWILPPMYLKRDGHSENPLQGQSTLFQVRSGSLFVAFGQPPSVHLAANRVDLHARIEGTLRDWSAVYLEAGDVL